MPLSEALFWAKVDMSAECWVWTGSRMPKGYGQLRRAGGTYTAHRFSWTLAHGPIPAGLMVLHHCDNPPCVRPDHLFLGTAKDNTTDMRSKGRARGGSSKGEAHPMARVTEADVLWIRAEAANGMPIAEIARRVGLTRSPVDAIVRRSSWRHVE